jgi:hypothetical protein
MTALQSFPYLLTQILAIVLTVIISNGIAVPFVHIIDVPALRCSCSVSWRRIERITIMITSSRHLRGLSMMLFLAELNQLDIWATDVGNAYLEAETKEKIYIIAGSEFGT